MVTILRNIPEKILRRSRARGIALSMAAAVLIPAVSHAVPAYPYPFTTTQPDGTELTIRLTGDEWTSRVYTSDDLLLLKGKDNAYVYATLSADNEIIPSTVIARNAADRSESEKRFIKSISQEEMSRAIEMSEAMATPRVPFTVTEPATRAAGAGLMYSAMPFPSKGSHNILVVLVEYPDKKFTHPDPKGYFDKLLNQEGYKEDGAYGSARDWFVSNSSGAFTPTFDVYGPVMLPNERSYYGGDRAGIQDPNAYKMVIDACEILDPTVDFTKYDANNDGYIDNVYIYYAGHGQADTAETDAVWPHSFDVVTATGGQEYKYDGVILNHYATSNEIRRDKGYTGIGTFMHEFSHVMGLPDLYSTVYTTAFTPGAWSILDYGPYNNNGMTPPNYTAYERYCLGWMKPDRLLYDGSYELKPIQDSNKAYIVTTDNDNEVFIFENRQQKDYDAYIPGHGMLVWNIVFNQDRWDKNTVNNIPNMQGVDIIEADNMKEDENRDSDPFPGTKGVTSFGPTTRPAFQTQGRRKIYYYFTEIAENNGNITFNLKTPNDPEGVDENITAQGGLSVSGHSVASTFDADCKAYDLSGRQTGVIPAHGSADLTKGIHIVMTPDGPVKIMI